MMNGKSLIEVLFESFKFTLSEYTTVPPSTPESCSVSDELDEGGSDRINANAQTMVPKGGVDAYQQGIQQNRTQAVLTEKSAQCKQCHS